MTVTSAAERHPFRLVDTIVKRESPNSPWVTVEFVGEGGETVSVRMPLSAAHPDRTGSSLIAGRALQLLKSIIATNGKAAIAIPRTGRFGVPNPEK